ncbi:mycothiol transferase [Dermacoccaceae bacterium W4C1]
MTDSPAPSRTRCSAAEVLIDATDRVLDDAISVLDRVTEDDLNRLPAPGVNPIGWLLWHAGRVQDAQIAPLSGQSEWWITSGLQEGFALDLPATDTGYGHTPEQVGKVQVTDAGLRAYLRGAHQVTVAHLQTLTDAALDEVIDTNWTPPVTQAARLVSIVNDATQHVGQAGYALGFFGSGQA